VCISINNCPGPGIGSGKSISRSTGPLPSKIIASISNLLLSVAVVIGSTLLHLMARERA
jgi:hypothetical protein